jgi:hypothetical protein
MQRARPINPDPNADPKTSVSDGEADQRALACEWPKERRGRPASEEAPRAYIRPLIAGKRRERLAATLDFQASHSKSGNGKSSQSWALNAACPISSCSTLEVHMQRPHVYTSFPSNSRIRHRNRRGRSGFADKDGLESRRRFGMTPKDAQSCQRDAHRASESFSPCFGTLQPLNYRIWLRTSEFCASQRIA